MRSIYRALSKIGTMQAAAKGPAALGKRVIRQKTIKVAAKAAKKVTK